MEYKTKRKLQATISHLQLFANACFEAKNVLGSDATPDFKLEAIRNCVVFFMTDSFYRSLKLARHIVGDDEAKGMILDLTSKIQEYFVSVDGRKNSDELSEKVESSFDVHLSKLDESIAEFKKELKEGLYEKIILLSMHALVAVEDFKVPAHDIFDDKNWETYTAMCDDLAKKIFLFYAYVTGMSNYLGWVLVHAR